MAFLAVAFVVVLVWFVVLVAVIRVRSDVERPVAAADRDLGFSGRAIRYTGGTIFAVDGHRFQGSFPFGELVVDEQRARIRLRSPMQELRGERIVRRSEVSAVLVGQRLGIPYVELVDDVRTHGRTRFYGGRNLVQALRDRGWPVAAPPSS